MANLGQAAQAARRAVARLARSDFNAFCNFVLRDEMTGASIRQGWIHEAWAQIRAQHERSVVISFPEAGKTQQIAALVLWELGNNPRLRFAIISRIQDQAIDVVRLIRGYIENSAELAEVFPELRRSSAENARWNETKLDVERPRGIKEPSVQAFGLNAGAITGKRVDRFVLDDVLDLTTTYTKLARAAVSKRFWGEIYNRRSADARFLVIGNPWHAEDFYCELERRGWPTYRFPVRVTAELKRQWKLGAPVGSPTWPERWPESKIAEYERDLPRAEFERAYMCKVSRGSASPFSAAALDHAFDAGARWPRLLDIDDLQRRVDVLALRKHAAESGYDEDWVEAEETRKLILGRVPTDDVLTITGVDPSTGSGRDATAIVTVAWIKVLHLRLVVEVKRGFWSIHQRNREIADTWQRWDSLVVYETAGQQREGQQVLSAAYPEMRILSLPTTRSRKMSPQHGLPALAHRFEQHAIAIANDGVLTEEHRVLRDEAENFDPEGVKHTGDCLMALWFADHTIYHHVDTKSRRVGALVIGGRRK